MTSLFSDIHELDQSVTSHCGSEKPDSLPNLLDTTASTTTTSSTTITSNSFKKVDDVHPSESKGVIQMNPQQEAHWKKNCSRRNSVASSSNSVHSSASTAEIREKEIARTVLRMAMNETNPVFSDRDTAKSKYTSGVILGDLIRYEADDARSVVSALSLSSRRSTSRSRSKSRDKSRSKSRDIQRLVSTNHSYQSHGTQSSHATDRMVTDEADRLYNEFMKNLSPRPDLTSRVNRSRSETVSSVPSDQRVKKATPILSKANMGRSSSVPATLKTALPQVDEDFDPFGLKDHDQLSNVNQFSQTETEQNWGVTVEGQNVRRYEFTFSEPVKSTSINVRKKKLSLRDEVNFTTSSSSGRKVQHLVTSQMNQLKQKVTAEEIHPDCLDRSLDISDISLSKKLEATFVTPRKTASNTIKKDPWEGFNRSETFSSISFHGKDLSMKTSTIEVADESMFPNEAIWDFF
jgi:hypothetical protein